MPLLPICRLMQAKPTMATPWCEHEGLLSSIYAPTHCPFASQQGADDATRFVGLWRSFVQRLVSAPLLHALGSSAPQSACIAKTPSKMAIGHWPRMPAGAASQGCNPWAVCTSPLMVLCKLHPNPRPAAAGQAGCCPAALARPAGRGPCVPGGGLYLCQQQRDLAATVWLLGVGAACGPARHPAGAGHAGGGGCGTG